MPKPIHKPGPGQTPTPTPVQTPGDPSSLSTWQRGLHADNKEEWREVCLRVRPLWDDAKFNSVWDSFLEYRRMHCVSP